MRGFPDLRTDQSIWHIRPTAAIDTVARRFIAILALPTFVQHAAFSRLEWRQGGLCGHSLKELSHTLLAQLRDRNEVDPVGTKGFFSFEHHHPKFTFC